MLFLFASVFKNSNFKTYLSSIIFLFTSFFTVSEEELDFDDASGSFQFRICYDSSRMQNSKSETCKSRKNHKKVILKNILKKDNNTPNSHLLSLN